MFRIRVLAWLSVGLLMASPVTAQVIQSAKQGRPVQALEVPYIGELTINLTADDATALLPAIPVAVQQHGLITALSTDSAGNTSAVEVVMTDPLLVTIGEAPTVAGGSTVGQQLVMHPALFTSGADSLTLAYYTPEARRQLFIPGELIYDDAASERWFAYAPSSAGIGSFSFSAAWLGAPKVARAFRAFHGEDVPLPDGPAFLLRLDNPLDLSMDPLLIMFNVEGSLLGPMPEVALMSYETSGPTAAVAQVVPYDPSFPDLDEGLVCVLLSGQLPAGDHLLQLTNDLFATKSQASSSHSNGSRLFLSNLDSPSEATQGCKRPGPPPCPPATCQPPAPKCSNCSKRALGAPQTVDGSKRMGSAVCNNGASPQKRVCATYSGGISVKVDFDTPFGGFEIGANGTVGGSDCTTISPDMGECAQAWICRQFTTQVWEVCRTGFLGNMWCTVVTTLCVEGGAISTTTCPLQ